MKRLLLILTFLFVARPSFAAIAYVTSGNVGDNNASSNFIVSYTANASTTLLVVTVVGDTIGGNCSNDAVTWNSVSMTLANSITTAVGGFNNRCLFKYFLVNPATGTNNFAFTTSTPHLWAAVASEYSGVGLTQPDATGTAVSAGNADTSLSTSLTTVADNSWVVEGMEAYGGNNPSTAGTGLTLRVCGTTYGEPCILDSNGPVHPAGSYSMAVNAPAGSANYIAAINASFAPAGGGGGGGGSGAHHDLLLGIH